MSPKHHPAGSFSDEDCLAEIMRLRFGSTPCPACDAPPNFTPLPKHRAFACRECGFKLFPCHGTPFAKSEPSLRDWFTALDLAADPKNLTPARLRRALGGNKRADALVTQVQSLSKRGDRKPGEIDWIEAAHAFVSGRRGGPAATEPGRPVNATHEHPETIWQTLRSAFAFADLDRRPLLGVAAILVLASLGAGIGWLAVPSPAEDESERVQATAVLTLAYDKPVILVSPEVAEQLYDVTDVDTQADSPLAASIRLAPGTDAGQSPDAVGDAKPLAQPSIKLSSGLGQSLLQGDVSGTKARAQTRPDLAAYNSLAQELEGGGQRNPDELLSFGPMRIRRYLVEKIVRAGRLTATDPVLLMAIADKESAFRTEVQAATSSASGLFQFIESTWLGVVREFGGRHGLDKEAELLSRTSNGGPDRARILDMRRDPYLSAVLAAEMLKRDSLRIQKRLGRALTGGEVYLVHFLGPDGAERMIDTINRKPDMVAADLLPKPAAANRPIFYGSDTTGGAKSLSVSEVRNKFETMISVRLDRYKTVHNPSPDSKRSAR